MIYVLLSSFMSRLLLNQYNLLCIYIIINKEYFPARDTNDTLQRRIILSLFNIGKQQG